MAISAESPDTPRLSAPELPRVLLERAVTEHFQFVWRCLRRFGISPTDRVDDAAQRVFEIAATKRTQIIPGRERAFLFRIARLVVLEEYRARKRDARTAPDLAAVGRAPAAGTAPDQLLEEREWRSRLDQALDELPEPLRTVFVLFELEGCSSPEIAELLELPVGTVASRLRRAREAFRAAASRLRSKLAFRGGDP